MLYRSIRIATLGCFGLGLALFALGLLIRFSGPYLVLMAITVGAALGLTLFLLVLNLERIIKLLTLMNIEHLRKRE